MALDGHFVGVATLAAAFAAGSFSGELVHLDRNAQGRVANDEGGVGLVEHFGRIGFGVDEAGRDVPVFGCENANESGRTAGGSVESESFDAIDWLFRNDKDAANFALSGDGHVGESDKIRDALVFDGRDDGHVNIAAAELLGALGRESEAEVVAAGERAFSKTPNQRSSVEVLDNRDAKFLRHVRCAVILAVKGVGVHFRDCSSP